MNFSQKIVDFVYMMSANFMITTMYSNVNSKSAIGATRGAAYITMLWVTSIRFLIGPGTFREINLLESLIIE